MNYSAFVKKLELPPGFTALVRLTYADLVASAISRANLSDDVRGINSSIALIQKGRAAAADRPSP